MPELCIFKNSTFQSLVVVVVFGGRGGECYGRDVLAPIYADCKYETCVFL